MSEINLKINMKVIKDTYEYDSDVFEKARDMFSNKSGMTSGVWYEHFKKRLDIIRRTSCENNSKKF